MNWVDALLTAGATGLIDVVAIVTFWACFIVAFFSIAIDASRIRKDVAALRELVEADSLVRVKRAGSSPARDRDEPWWDAQSPHMP